MRFPLVIMLAFGAIAAAPEPPAKPAPEPAPPPPCVSPPNPRDSAEYIPGADAYGRPVAPADLPGTPGVQIRTEVYPILKSRNPQLNGVGVVANLPSLANRPLCPPGAAPINPETRR